jgi:phenylpyruvate tautomerase
MPFIKLETSAPITSGDREDLVRRLTKIAADVIGKPEDYVMASLSEAKMTMGGQPGPAAFLDIRSIGGLDKEVNREITKQVSELLEEKLRIPSDRIFVCFSNIAAQNWGWNKSTFG